MKFHIADYEIVLAPAGQVALVACIAIFVLSVVAIVWIVQRRGRA
jgi:hypothetical protein